MAEGSKPTGALRQIIWWIIATTLCLYLAKVLLRAPEYRHYEVCYLPHKVAHLFWVDAWGYVVPDHNATYLKHSRDLSEFFTSCTQRVGGWTWLRSIGTSSPQQ